MGATEIVANAESLAVSRPQPSGTALLESQSTTTPATTTHTALSSLDMVPTTAGMAEIPDIDSTDEIRTSVVNFEPSDEISSDGCLTPAVVAPTESVAVFPIAGCIAPVPVSCLTSNVLAVPVCTVPTSKHPPYATAAVQGTAEEIPTKPPSTCSTECVQVHDSTCFPTPGISFTLSHSAAGEHIKRSMYCCSGVPSMLNTARSSTPTWVFAENINSFDKQSWLPPPQAVVSSDQGMHKLVVGTLIDAMLDVIFPWPPPIQWVMQIVGAELRPRPWPSFGSCNAQCASGQYSKKDMDFMLWISWKIPWQFFWKLSCVYLLYIDLISCSVDSCISIWKYAVWFIQFYQHTVLVDLGCYQEQQVFLWHLGGEQCFLEVPESVGCLRELSFWVHQQQISGVHVTSNIVNQQLILLDPGGDHCLVAVFESVIGLGKLQMQPTVLSFVKKKWWLVLFQLLHKHIIQLKIGGFSTDAQLLRSAGYRAIPLYIFSSSIYIVSATLIHCYEWGVQLHRHLLLEAGDGEASNINGAISEAMIPASLIQQVQVLLILVECEPLLLLYSENEKGLLPGVSYVVIKIKYVVSINDLQAPWDPGGLEILYRLEGKPIVKEGRMLGTSYMTMYLVRPMGYEVLLVGPACQYLGQQPMYPVVVSDGWSLAICKQRWNQRRGLSCMNNQLFH